MNSPPVFEANGTLQPVAWPSGRNETLMNRTLFLDGGVTASDGRLIPAVSFARQARQHKGGKERSPKGPLPNWIVEKIVKRFPTGNGTLGIK